jgi:hypothetical protein
MPKRHPERRVKSVGKQPKTEKSEAEGAKKAKRPPKTHQWHAMTHRHMHHTSKHWRKTEGRKKTAAKTVGKQPKTEKKAQQKVEKGEKDHPKHMSGMPGHVDTWTLPQSTGGEQWDSRERELMRLGAFWGSLHNPIDATRV